MSHPLAPHYAGHLRRLLVAEYRFLEFVHDLQHDEAPLKCCFAGLECSARQRMDSLHALAFSAGHPLVPSRELPDSAHALATPPRGPRSRARSMEACVACHRELINGYRVARGIAAKLGRKRHAERIDALLGTMTDTFPHWLGNVGGHGTLATSGSLAG